MVSEISSSEYAIDDTLSRLRNLAMCREYLKEASRCTIQAACDVGIQNPLCGLADALPDCVDGVPAPSAWSKAVAVWLEYRLPFRLNDHFHQCLFGSVHHRGYTQWPHLGLTRFGNPDTAYRSCLVREVHGLDHLKAFFGGEFGYPVDARRILSAVVLGLPSDREGPCGS